ncbi:surfactant protein Bb isoform X1 [Centroberyx affinis]|uniref:surfactant protein Bb isoform X1 n=1 Tax=Centroberyx affinis TaxID=166261 RepID=UPI003A5C7356
MAVFGFILVIFMVFLCPGDSRFIKDPLSSKWDTTQQSLTSGTCSKCSQILELFTDMISKKDTQEILYETLHALCRRLPSERVSECDSQVKTYLPKILQYTAGHLQPGEACMVLGLCAVQSEKEALKLPHPVTDKDSPSSALSTGTSTHAREQVNPQCTLCLFLMKKLEDMLPKNKTEDAIVKLMGEVCGLLPEKYEEECDDFINKYGKQIIDFLLSSAAPHSICAMLHLCLFTDTSGTETLVPSDCESCRTLAVLSRLHLGLNSTEPHTSSFLQSVCLHHPSAIPKCEVFTKLYGSRLQKVLGNQMDVPDACERVDLCVAMKKQEPLGKDRCTLGPSYWCRDSKIAQKCGNLAFCEKYMWN